MATFPRSYSAAAPTTYGRGRSYYDTWRRDDASTRSQSRGRSQWRPSTTYNTDWNAWNEDYGTGRSQSRGRGYGSWGNYGSSESSSSTWGYKNGYWVGDWWYCGHGDWYWSKDNGYFEWKKNDYDEGNGYYPTYDYYTPSTPKYDWKQDQWDNLGQGFQGYNWQKKEDWNDKYYYYDKNASTDDRQWEERIDMGWHLSSKFPRAPKTLDEHYEPGADANTPGNAYTPYSARIVSPSPYPLAEPSRAEAAENCVWLARGAAWTLVKLLLLCLGGGWCDRDEGEWE